MAIRLCFLLLATMAATAFAEKRPDSCMLRRTLRAGVPLAKARVMEQHMKTFRVSEGLVRRSPPEVLGPLLRSSVLHVQALQQCIAQRSKTCMGYMPCHHGGKCQLSAAKRQYECKCTSDYTGHDCSKSHPAPLSELRVLQREIKMQNQKIKALQQTIANSPYKLSGCRTTDVGYAYKQHNEHEQSKNSGELNHISYQKKRDDTVLLITYSNNIRTYGAETGSRWYVKVDGRECSVPSRIEIAMYQSSGDNTFVPAVLTGICQQTASGHLRKGTHRISIHVGAIRGGAQTQANAASGWRSSSLLEVKEMCPGF